MSYKCEVLGQLYSQCACVLCVCIHMSVCVCASVTYVGACSLCADVCKSCLMRSHDCMRSLHAVPVGGSLMLMLTTLKHLRATALSMLRLRTCAGRTCQNRKLYGRVVVN